MKESPNGIADHQLVNAWIVQNRHFHSWIGNIYEMQQNGEMKLPSVQNSTAIYNVSSILPGSKINSVPGTSFLLLEHPSLFAEYVFQREPLN